MPRKLSTSHALCHGGVWVHSEPPRALRAAQQHPVSTREAAWHGESVTAKVTPAQRDLLPSLFTSRSVQRWPRLSRSDRHEGHPGAVLVLLGRAGAGQGRTPHHSSCSASGSRLCLPAMARVAPGGARENLGAPLDTAGATEQKHLSKHHSSLCI